MSNRILSLLVFATSLGTCGPTFAASPNIPNIPRDIPVVISSDLPSKKLKGGNYAVPDSYYGILAYKKTNNHYALFGLLGGIAHAVSQRNASASKSENQALFANNLANILATVAPNFTRPTDKPLDRVEIIPAATFLFVSDQDFAKTCTLEASIFSGGKKVDGFRITISWSPLYSPSDQNLSGKLHDGLQACMKSGADILDLLKLHDNEDFHRATFVAPNGKKISWNLLKPEYPQRFITADGNRVIEYAQPDLPRSPDIRFDDTD